MQWSVIGHMRQREQLERLLARGVLPHALLFAGADGIGKRTLARELALAYAGSSLPLDGNPDMFQIAPVCDEKTGKLKDIPVEAIREHLRPWAYLRPVHGASKIAIIDAAERMTDEAANTLLKILEEPPAYLTFLLISALPQAILPTVLSRCEVMRFDRLTDDEMKQALQGMPLTSDQRTLLAAVAAGRPGAARALIAEKMFPRVAASVAALDHALTAGVAERILLARDTAESDDPAQVCEWWIGWLREQLPAHPERSGVLHELLACHDILRAPQFNRRLALERALLTK